MKNGCCIVETRPLGNLNKLINDHLRFVPDEWGLTIYCSKRNKHLLRGLSRKATLITLKDSFTVSDYNRLFKSVKFWDSLPYNKVLIFQTDSMLLKHGIEDFLEWDYVGSPWKFQEHGGNGGLSLRSVQLMKYICENYKFTTRNEDVLFCNIMKDHNLGKLAPREVCKKFSTEAIFEFGTIGYHGIHNWLSKEQQDLIKNQYGTS